MSNNTQLISRPIKEGCIFNAVGNPIIYNLRREDYTYNQVNNSGGFAQFQINGTDLTAYFEVTNDIYAEVYGIGGVSAVAFSGGNTLITTDLAYIAGGTGYINNLSKRTDYKIEVEVFDSVTEESLGPRIVHNPDLAGEVKADVSGTIRPHLVADWTQTTLNDPEEGTSKKVFIEYQEFYDEEYKDIVSDDLNPIIGVLSIMHLLQNSPPNFARYANGGNLLSFCPEDDTRKWLTRFPQPSMWRGWPFDLSFLWSDFLEISRRVKQYDEGGNLITEDVDALTTDMDKVHRVSIGTLHADAKLILMSLEQGSSGSGSGGVDQILEDITIQVKEPCDNQIYLFWKAANGGDAFWMFDENQNYQYRYPSGRVVNRLTLYADNLTVSEWDAINQLNSVSDVVALNVVDTGMDDSIDKTHYRDDNQVFIVNADGSKVGVIVIANDNETKTNQKKHAIEITIELPELYTV
jgi:hypothetical protein